MGSPVIAIRINDLIDFLADKREEPLKSKYVELHSAVILAKFLSKQRGEEHWIGFPAKEKKRREFDKVPEISNFEDVLNEFVEEDSPQDVFITPEHQVKNRANEIPKGDAFQLKRVFAPDPDSSLEDQIVKYINDVIPNKYAKASGTNLVLLLSTRFSGEGFLNVKNVRDRLKLSEFPFDRIMIVTAERDDRIVLGEIWPGFGAHYYTKEEFNSLNG